MNYPTDRKSCGYSIRYIKWLCASDVALEVGPDAFALLVAVVTQEDEIHFTRPPNFFNDQLARRCGIGSEPALIRARKRAINAGLLFYKPGAKRRPGVYFVSGYANDSLANAEGIRRESAGKAQPSIPIPLPLPKNKRPKRAIGQPLFSKEDSTTAQWMFGLIQDMHPDHMPPSFDKWANEIRLIRERDKRNDSQIRSLFQAANADSFWKKNILSPAKLREKWDDLTIKLGKQVRSAPSSAPSEPKLAPHEITALRIQQNREARKAQAS